MSNSGRKQSGKSPQGTQGFGKPQNQGRNAFSQNSGTPEGNTGRGRANAIFGAPVAETQGRARSNAISSHQSSSPAQTGGTGPGKPMNQGRTAEGNSTAPASGFKPGNLGRGGYQPANQNRNGLTPGQQAGFNLVSGFMSKLIEQADRNGSGSSDPDRRAQQNQNMQQDNQGQGNQAEEERRRANSQMGNRDDDKVTGKEFFQRLQSAMADPEGFKKRVADKQAAKQNQSEQQRQASTSPSSASQSSTSTEAEQQGEPRKQGGSITGKEFFQRLQSAMKDPQGFKRRVEAEKKQPDKAAAGANNGPGKTQQLAQNQTGRQRANAITGNSPGANTPGQSRTAAQQVTPQKHNPQKPPGTAPKAKPKPRPKSG